MPVVGGAAILAGGAVAGGVISSGASNAAGKRQSAANQQALDYQKDQDALVEKHRLEDRQLQQAAWDAEQARKAPARAAAASIWRRLGINVPETTSVMPPNWTGATAGTAGAMPAAAAASMTLEGLYGSGQAQAPAATGVGAPTAAMTLEEFLARRRPTTLDQGM